MKIVPPKQHVMISYNWGSKKIAKLIYDVLVQLNIPVWMDTEGGMSQGNIHVAMAEGVENAFCIVALITKAYEDSKNCRKELNYSDTQNKEIYPCLVEEGYQGSGWLGLIIAGQLYFDFRRGDEEEVAKNLANAIKGKFSRQILGKNILGKLTDEQIFYNNFRGRVYHLSNPGNCVSSYFYFKMDTSKGE